MTWLVLLLRHLAGGAANTDFANYYDLGRVALREGWAHLYDVPAQAGEWSKLGLHGFVPIPQAPPLALAATPFAALPMAVAWALWGSICLGLTVGAWYLAAGGPRGRRAVSIVVGLSPVPVIMALSFGQASLLVAAVVVAAWWLMEADHPVESGLVLSLIALKPQVAFLVPLTLLASGRWRVSLAWCSGTAALSLASLALLGWGGVHGWLALVQEAAAHPGRFYVPTQLTLVGVLGVGLPGQAARLLAVAAAAAVARRRRSDAAIPVAAGLLASLLVTPFVHVQDLALLVPAALLCTRCRVGGWRLALLGVGYVAADLADAAVGGPIPLVLFEMVWLAALWGWPARGSRPAAQPREHALRMSASAAR